MEKEARIYVAGHSGMVGSAVVRCLAREGFENLILRTSSELDLTRQAEVEEFFHDHRPEYVFLAAARVGGILANNTYRADFIYRNLQIQANVIHNARVSGVRRLLFFSSSCIYPRNCPQPMKETHLWTGLLEPTNEPYAVAKLAGMSMCAAYNAQHGTSFFPVIPTNLYGPNDNFDPEQSHLLAALIRKFHIAKVEGRSTVTLWGTGRPRRELMHVDDAASAAVDLMQHYESNDSINVGIGVDKTIRDIAGVVSQIVGYQGEVSFDETKPDGAPQKLLDTGRLKTFGWKPRINFDFGVADAYAWYLKNIAVTTV